MQITLELNDDEQAHLTSAVVEYYHRLKDSATNTTYGAMITDERVLVARDVWDKVEEQIGLGRWA